jgi:PPIC-type PPIASE domain
MRNACSLCLLLALPAWAQANPGAAGSHPPAANQQYSPATASAVAAGTPVLTINGLCAETEAKVDAASSKQPCRTTVTRAQFEKLVSAIDPNADAATRRQIAKAYPQFLIMAAEAHRRGLDKDPSFQERIAFARLQILSQALTHQIQHDAAQVPEKDIENWYQSHLGDFEEATFERVVVPDAANAETAPTPEGEDKGGEKDADAMTHEAERLRVRAVAGEDFVALQKEAYEFAGMAGNNKPNPKLPDMRRRGLPPGHASVFDLKAGEVSAVISDGTGHYIYKLDSRQTLTLQAVREEISNALRRQRIKEMMEGVQQPFTTDVNTAYFGAESSAPSD